MISVTKKVYFVLILRSWHWGVTLWVNWISLVYFQHCLKPQIQLHWISNAQISRCICQQYTQERERFPVFCDSLYDTERPRGHSAKTSKEINLKGSWSTIKPLRWNIICQHGSLSMLFIFSPIFVVFHLASNAVFLLNSSVRKTENMDRQHVLPHLSSRLGITQPCHSIGCVFSSNGERMCAFAWHCSMCISRHPISFGMMCSSLISFLTPLQCDGNLSRHHRRRHFKPR